ncbi:uncharacterized protein LOC111829545 [Capsella rubella]|uniref:uncharacterized protein LOC111829545 n=1 Tax=Capsella rubella TaxID=81985 RepID=UPI000CD4BEC6|nr:uncharacterized protein LOC111829545 [Capsella rubella]
MCSGFLWKCSPNSARGAKVSWDIVCSSKETGADSLWISWMRINVIRNRNFWDLNPVSHGSWIWSKLCKLRDIVRPFIICEVGSEVTASFWHDNWTVLRPLLLLVGPNAPQIIGFPVNAVVRDAIRGRQWWITSTRSRNPVMVEMLIDCQHDDVYLWKPDHHAPSNIFSTFLTWQLLHLDGPSVPWHDAVWFKHQIPEHTFTCWVTAKKRLYIRDRLHRWGIQVPLSCLL